MNKLAAILIGLALGVSYSSAQPVSSNRAPATAAAQLRTEQLHFLECLAFVYDPSHWISYTGALYFSPFSDADLDRLEEMKTARSKYLAFTNRLDRHKVASQALTGSGIGETWRKKILLPYSATNADLTPTFARPVRRVLKYEVLKTFPGGDALITDDDSAYFVMDYGRAAADRFRTNAVLVKEGMKSFRQPSAETISVEAFANAGLSQEEIQIFRSAAAAFAKNSVGSGETNTLASSTAPPAPKPSREPDGSELALQFQMHRSRASDDSPYLQFLLAKDYLEGLGTEKNEKLGLEWMQRAAGNGSGDARTFLDQRGIPVGQEK